MATNLRKLGWSIFLGLVPYPDRRKRSTVRDGARALVSCEPWPGLDAKGPDAARLALLRLLWLQRQARLMARLRQTEPTVMLARAAVESCLLGLYCLGEGESAKRLQADYIKAIRNLLAYLVDDGFVPKDLVDRASATYGMPSKAPVRIYDMAVHLERTMPESGAVSLYRRFYVPTSTFFFHANAASLLRHVKDDKELTERPLTPWTRRSAMHVADSCVGLLASAVAQHDGKATTVFVDYEKAHISRALTPLAVMVGKGFTGSIKWDKIPDALQAFRWLRKYYSPSGQAKTDDIEVRKARTRAAYERLFGLSTQFDEVDAALEMTMDHFVTVLAESVDDH